MHGAQRFRGVRLNEQLTQVRPQSTVLRHGVVQSASCIVESALGFHGQLHSMARYEREETQYDLRISRACRLLNVNAAVDD
jgi:hypothetical protein